MSNASWRLKGQETELTEVQKIDSHQRIAYFIKGPKLDQLMLTSPEEQDLENSPQPERQLLPVRQKIKVQASTSGSQIGFRGNGQQTALDALMPNVRRMCHK